MQLHLLDWVIIVGYFSDMFAISPEVFAIMDDSFEREYFDVFEICDNDYPVL